MDLFSSLTATAADPVQSAIQKAATSTGAGFGYLLTTAQRESGLNPSARAPTSSATGLFQFIDSTWMQIVKDAGPSLGLGDVAGQIAKTEDGAYVAPDAATRQEILALRNDPDINALMAGALTRQNRDMLSASLGREPSDGELYVAHFMGAKGAADLIRLAATDGEAPAAAAFPRHAQANPSIFYDRTGQALSAASVYSSLVRRFDGTASLQAVAADERLPANPAAWLAIPAHNAYAAEARMPFHGLFRSDASAPISNYVAATWSNIAPPAHPAEAAPASSPAPVEIRPGVAAEAPPPPIVAPTTSEAEDDLFASVGSFFSTLFASSQSAPLRHGKAWGG